MPEGSYDQGYRDGYDAGERDAEDSYDDDWCERDHCDDYTCHCAPPIGDSNLGDLVKDYLRQIRMGYTIEVTLQDILEEMERSLNE